EVESRTTRPAIGELTREVTSSSYTMRALSGSARGSGASSASATFIAARRGDPGANFNTPRSRTAAGASAAPSGAGARNSMATTNPTTSITAAVIQVEPSFAIGRRGTPSDNSRRSVANDELSRRRYRRRADGNLTRPSRSRADAGNVPQIG